VWAATQVGSKAALLDGSQWTQMTFTADLDVRGLAIAGERAGTYWILYRGKSPDQGIYSMRYQDGTWSLRGNLGTSDTETMPAVAARGGVLCAAWPVGTRIDAGLTRNGVLLSAPAVTSTAAIGELAVAVNNGLCIVVAATLPQVRSSWSTSGSSWTAHPAILSGWADEVAIAPFGTADFVAAGVQNGSLWFARETGGTSAWSVTWPYASFSDLRPPARAPLVARSSSSTGALAFAQGNPAEERVWAAIFNVAPGGIPEILNDTHVDGAASDTKLAVASTTGDVMAVWNQEHQGRTSVYWRVRQAETWTPPQQLAENATVHAIASNGTGFMVAYSSGQTLSTRKWTGAGFGTAVTISTGYDVYSAELASHGSGYAIGYVVYDPTSGYKGRAHGVDFSLPVKILTGTGATTKNLAVAARSGEYVFAWINETTTAVSAMSWRATGGGTSFAWEGASKLIQNGARSGRIVLAAGPNGFAALYPYGSTWLFGSIMTSGNWGPGSAIVRPDGADAYAVASNGTGYLAVTSRLAAGGTQSHAWNGSWQGGRQLPVAPGLGLSAASNGSGYGVLATSSTSPASVTFMSIPEPVSGPVGTPVRVDSAAARDATAPLVSTTAGYLAGWEQRDPADPAVVRAYVRGGL
jgi:hypothetical protein